MILRKKFVRLRLQSWDRGEGLRGAKWKSICWTITSAHKNSNLLINSKTIFPFCLIFCLEAEIVFLSSDSVFLLSFGAQSRTDRQTDRQTDRHTRWREKELARANLLLARASRNRQTDRQTDRQTKPACLLHAPSENRQTHTVNVACLSVSFIQPGYENRQTHTHTAYVACQPAS